MATTVQDVIDMLLTMDPSLPMILSVDGEGNSYNHVGWVGVMGYEEFGGEIETGKLSLTQEERNEGWTDEDIKPNACVVIG